MNVDVSFQRFRHGATAEKKATLQFLKKVKKKILAKCSVGAPVQANSVLDIIRLNRA